MAQLPVFHEKRQQQPGTPLHFMGHPHIDRRDILHAQDPPAVIDHFSGHADPVTALHGEKSLPQLLLIGIEGIIARQLHGLPQFLFCHHISQLLPACQISAAGKIIHVAAPDDLHRPVGPQPDLPDIVIIQAGTLQRPFQFGRKQPDDFLFPVHMSTSYPYYM